MSRFQENLLEIRKKANANRVEKIFRKFFHAFFKDRKFCGGVSILSNPLMYPYYRIGIDTFVITNLGCKEAKFGKNCQNIFQYDLKFKGHRKNAFRERFAITEIFKFKKKKSGNQHSVKIKI